jgi:glyoxylate utilization-related uncharacterized protein
VNFHERRWVAGSKGPLFFVEGNGEITIGEKTWPLWPGSYAKVEAGKEHSLRNPGDGEMVLLTVYDPRACATDHEFTPAPTVSEIATATSTQVPMTARGRPRPCAERAARRRASAVAR